jgi:hypothetical protein
MYPKVTRLVLLSSGVIVVAAFYLAVNVTATTAQRFTSTTLSLGRFGDIEVFNRLSAPNLNQDDAQTIWLSLQKTKGASDLYVQSNVWQPVQTGMPVANTGWHTHPGHSLITVTAGTVTAYEGNDPDCKPHVYTVGMGFVDPGHGHVHIIRNEGDVVAQTITVQLIPAGQPRRIDAPDPGNCHFSN